MRLQIDALDAPFHPYRAAADALYTIKTYTRDPLEQLRQLYDPEVIFVDMPLDRHYQKAILHLHEQGVLFGENKRVRPFDWITKQDAVAMLSFLQEKYTDL